MRRLTRRRRRSSSSTARSRSGAERDRGAVLLVTAFVIVGLMGVTALVVDIVMVHNAKIRAQATADAAVLAAAQDMDDPNEAALVAEAYAARNEGVSAADWAGCEDPDALAGLTIDNCVSFDDPDAPSHVRVRIPNQSVRSVFGRVLGVSSYTVTAEAIAEVTFGVSDSEADDYQPNNRPSVRAGFTGGFPVSCPDNFWDVPVPDPLPAGYDPTKPWWREYIFVFEHTDGTLTAFCDTNRWGRYLGMEVNDYPPDCPDPASTTTTTDGKKTKTKDGGGVTTISGFPNNAPLPGGCSSTDPVMTLAHVSCSGNWDSGWSTKDHPTEYNDPEWRVVYYALDVRGSDDEIMNDPVYDAKKDTYKVNKQPDEGYGPCEDSIGDLSFAPIYADPPRAIRLSD